MRTTNSPDLVYPKGHYSHATTHQGTIYLAGQLPVTPDGTPLSDASFAEQVAQVLRNLDAAMNAAHTSKSQLLFVNVYVTNIEEWGTFDELYSQWLGSHRPARVVAEVANLHFGCQVEVSAVAASSEQER